MQLRHDKCFNLLLKFINTSRIIYNMVCKFGILVVSHLDGDPPLCIVKVHSPVNKAVKTHLLITGYCPYLIAVIDKSLLYGDRHIEYHALCLPGSFLLQLIVHVYEHILMDNSG